ncbi:MAG: NAD-binding protein [Candidatus Marsarchaeota archaeon]|jgi:voltage-gated potassium channel|nr:NAD-binding protein [Candidatus Marsarchaeota archaeon]
MKNQGNSFLNETTLTFRIIIILAITAIFYALFMILFLTKLINNEYLSSYYVIGSLFDTTGIESKIGGIAMSLSQGQFIFLSALLALTGIIKIIVVGILIGTITSIIYKLSISLPSIKKLNNHVIICGYSDLSETIAKELTTKKRKFIIIENNPVTAETAEEEGFRVIKNDFTKDEILDSAKIKNATEILFLTKNDYNNLLGIITAKHLNNNIKIITRSNDIHIMNKMKRAGASLCIIPEILTGAEIGNILVSLSKPT